MQHTTYRRLHSSSFVLRLLSAKTSLRQTEQNESTLHEMLQIQLKVSSHFVEVTHSNSRGLLGISIKCGTRKHSEVLASNVVLEDQDTDCQTPVGPTK
jgi:hypothetical protein